MSYTDRFTARGVVGLAAAGTSLVAVCYGLARFAYGLFVPTFRAEFGLDAATAGLVASGSYAGYCVAIVAATAATTRWGARPVALLAGASATAGTALVAAATGPVVLACGVVIAGSSTGLASPPLADAVSRSVPGAREPRVQAVVNAGTGLGVLVSGPVALAAGANWRPAWAGFAVAALLVTVWVGRTLRPGHPGAVRPDGSDRDPDRDPAADGPVRSGMPAVRRPAAPDRGRLLAAAALMGFGSAAVWTFGRDLVDAATGDGATGTWVWVALGAAGLLGAFAGDLTVRVGLGRSWSTAMLLLGAATAVLALGAAVPAVAVVAAAGFGAVYIVLTGLLLLWGTRVYAGRPAVGVGAAFLLIALGQAVGAPALGAVADAVGPSGAFLLAAALTVLGAVVRPGTSARRSPAEVIQSTRCG